MTTHFSTEDPALGELRRGDFKGAVSEKVSMEEVLIESRTRSVEKIKTRFPRDVVMSAWRKLFPAAVTL